ncbi:MAG: putative quinol monooxygenase [Planctomycetota bacterium]
MIFVIADIDLEAGKRAEFLTAFNELVPKVLAEEGCIEYGPTIDVETNIDAQSDRSDDRVTVVEKWESLDALERHLMAPHMLEYRDQVGAIVKSVSLKVLEPAT